MNLAFSKGTIGALTVFWMGLLPTSAFTWDSNVRAALSTQEVLDYYPESRILTVLDADRTGAVLVVWKQHPWYVKSKLYQPGQGWANGAELHYSFDPASDLLGKLDAAMAPNGHYCLVASEVRVADGGGYIEFYKLKVDIVIGGVSVADDLQVAYQGGNLSFNVAFPDFRTAVSANGDTLVAWGNSFTHQVVAKLRRGGAWLADFVLDAVDIRTLAVATDETGNFIVVWNPASESNKLYCRRFSAGAWGERELVGQSDSAGEEQFPQVGMFRNGGALVAWRHRFATHDGAAIRRFDGAVWSGLQRIDNNASILGPPGLAVQSDGKAVVLFQHQVGSQAEGPLYANRFDGSTWSGSVDIGCTLPGGRVGVDMDGNGNAVAAFKTGTTMYWHAYQEGLGWLGCSAQGRGSQPNLMDIAPPELRRKAIALTPHEIVGAWVEPYGSGGTLYANVARKDVLIDGYAMETADAVVDLSVRLPYNDICTAQDPPVFQQMRFSNNGTLWSAWETAPSSPPYLATKVGWDLANSAYGGNPASGLKRVYIQFRNANCESFVTHDDILWTGGGVTGVDIGLRVRSGANTLRIAAEPAGTLASPLRIRKNGTTYGIVLVDPAAPNASGLRVKTAQGMKAWAKLP